MDDSLVLFSRFLCLRIPSVPVVSFTAGSSLIFAIDIATKRVYSGSSSYIRSIVKNSCLANVSEKLELLAAAADDGVTRTWPVQALGDVAESSTQSTQGDSALTVDFKNNILASGSKDYSVHILDIPEHTRAAAASRKHSAAVDAVGRYTIATQSVVRSIVVRWEQEKTVSRLTTFQLSDDGSIVICGGGDGTIRSWHRRENPDKSSNAPSSVWARLQSGVDAHEASVLKMVRSDVCERCQALISVTDP